MEENFNKLKKIEEKIPLSPVKKDDRTIINEIQAAIIVAQKIPRNEQKALSKILESAKRKSLAEKAKYAYPRSGEIITGASIRTAENIAKYWGNISFGIKELSQDTRNNTSEVMAYAWDLETNVRQEKIFQVPHIRFSTKYGNKILTDPRDIYEKVANDASRRLRACILGILPADIVEDFLLECDKTLEGDNAEPLKSRFQKMLKAFDEFGVTQEMIEKRFKMTVDNFTIKHLADLRAIYNTVKDDILQVNKFFGSEKDELNIEKTDIPFN